LTTQAPCPKSAAPPRSTWRAAAEARAGILPELQVAREERAEA